MLRSLALAFAATAAAATETVGETRRPLRALAATAGGTRTRALAATAGGTRARALAANAGETRTQRITSFLPFVNVDGEAFYGQRQLAIVAAMALQDFNARDGHLVPRFAALDEP